MICYTYIFEIFTTIKLTNVFLTSIVAIFFFIIIKFIEVTLINKVI